MYPEVRTRVESWFHHSCGSRHMFKLPETQFPHLWMGMIKEGLHKVVVRLKIDKEGQVLAQSLVCGEHAVDMSYYY